MNMSMNECKSRILEIWSELETNKNDGFYKQLYESNKPFHIYFIKVNLNT